MIFALALAAATPSFDCAKATSAVEKMICDYESLAIADAAVSSLYKQIRRTRPFASDQRDWLADRDTCKNRYCLQSTYEDRIGSLMLIIPSVKDYHSGRYGVLRIVSLGKDTYAFWIQNLWVGGAPGQVNTAGASGAFQLLDDRGERSPLASFDSGWRLIKLPKGGWRVACLPDETQCGGINATIDGVYR